jgi:predicted HAD superfamily Cof-like phosphohydrolase
MSVGELAVGAESNLDVVSVSGMGGVCLGGELVAMSEDEVKSLAGKLSQDERSAMEIASIGSSIVEDVGYLREYFSPVAISNLYTMTATGMVRPEMSLPERVGIPSEEVRLLRARLILEEAIETIRGLGFTIETVSADIKRIESLDDVYFELDQEPVLEQIIDGCNDLIYVAVGTMLACGVADVAHDREVCRANDEKFPGGVAEVNKYGKFQKPFGWRGPDHFRIFDEVDSRINVRLAGERVMEVRRKKRLLDEKVKAAVNAAATGAAMEAAVGCDGDGDGGGCCGGKCGG